MKKKNIAPAEANVYLNKSSASEINKVEGTAGKNKRFKNKSKTVIGDHKHFSLDFVNAYSYEEQANIENWD